MLRCSDQIARPPALGNTAAIDHHRVFRHAGDEIRIVTDEYVSKAGAFT
jgi:hypothetical protein